MNRRKILGLTQRQIADVVGVTDQAVSDWERGVRQPRLTPRQAADLCETLQVSIEGLAEIFDESRPDERDRPLVVGGTR